MKNYIIIDKTELEEIKNRVVNGITPSELLMIRKKLVNILSSGKDL